MKIAHFVPTLNPGGAERVTADLATRFARAGHEVTVFAAAPSDSEAATRRHLDPSVRVEYIEQRQVAPWRVYLAGLRWTWRNRPRLHSFDVVHCHLTYGAFIGTVLGLYRRLDRSQHPAIVETYHAVGMHIPRLKRWVHSLMVGRRDVLVLMAADPYWTRFAKEHPQLAVRTILNGASAPAVDRMDEAARRRYRAQLGIPDNAAFIAGSIGMLRSDRQPWLFVPIIARLVRELGSGVHWIFAGNGPERERLQKMIDAAGLSQQVHFAGLVQDVSEPLSILDLHITLTVGDVSGVAAIEAALAGVPGIGVQLVPSHSGGDGDWIWSSSNQDAVAERTVCLLRNPAERLALATRQKEYATVHRSIEAMARSYNDVYELACRRLGVEGRA